MKAFSSYVKSSDSDFIWDKIIRDERICAYGFNALLDVNRDPIVIGEALKFLREKQVNDGCNMNVDFLARHATRILGDATLSM